MNFNFKYLNLIYAVIIGFLLFEVYTLRSDLNSLPQIYIVEESKFDDISAYKDVDVKSMYSKLRQVAAYLSSKGDLVFTDRAFVGTPNKEATNVNFIGFKDIEKLVLQDRMQQFNNLNIGK